MKDDVPLVWEDVETAAWIGLRRAVGNLRNGVPDRFGAGYSNGGIEPHVHGALVELAVAQHFNLHWRGAMRMREIDVGGCIEVKSIRRATDSLLLHPDSHDDLPYVLGLVERLPVVTLCGWILGRDGKRPEYWGDPVGGRPAFFVPQSALRSMPELKLHLRKVLARFGDTA